MSQFGDIQFCPLCESTVIGNALREFKVREGVHDEAICQTCYMKWLEDKLFNTYHALKFAREAIKGERNFAKAVNYAMRIQVIEELQWENNQAVAFKDEWIELSYYIEPINALQGKLFYDISCPAGSVYEGIMGIGDIAGLKACAQEQYKQLLTPCMAYTNHENKTDKT